MPSYNTSSAGRQDSAYDTSSRGYVSSNRTYDSSSHRDYDAVYGSSRGRDYTTDLHRPPTRCISPPRSHAEQPRHTFSYSDHRSVSPLGSSRFEQPSPYSSRQSQRSYTTRDVHEIPSYGHDGYYGRSAATAPFTGAGLSRSNAVRGRDNERAFGLSSGYAGGVSDARRETRRQVSYEKPHFSRGDFSSDRY